MITSGLKSTTACFQSLAQFEQLGYGRLPICMAKTQYSLSHDANLKNRPSGFTVPIRQIFRPRLTDFFPKEKRPKPERFHGRHVLNRYEDGMEKCIGCELCAGVCPAKCIYVRGQDNDPDAPTSPGERRMRPTFGCAIHSLVFAPINPTTLGLMHQYVADALTMWEPRIVVESLELLPMPDSGRVDIEIQYSIRSTKDERTLVYPFYVIREEQS